jgi:VIT1/CCC1 family predicted Fe2+/Mn2+ transporter
VVAGAAGAYLSPRVVLIMGFANLLADGFSMSVGNYLGARSQQEYWLHERQREMWEIENLPEAEREEIHRLYRRKGFGEPMLGRIVETITGDKERWADEMMREELGIQEKSVAPLASGLTTFGAFFLAGLLPLVPYVAGLVSPGLMAGAFPISAGATLVALFGVGVARRFLTRRPWWRSGLEILGMGGLASVAAFAAGHLLQKMIG